MATDKSGEVTDRGLNVGTARLLDVMTEDVVTRDVVATRGVVARRVVGMVANSVPGTEGARVVFPEDSSSLHSARVLPLRQQPKVAQ